MQKVGQGGAKKLKERLRILSSLRFKIALAFAVVLVAALAVINYYPVQIVRHQMISAAEADMRSGAITLATGLSTLSSGLKAEEIESAVAFFEPALSRRVMVANEYGIIVYDSVKTTGMLGRMALFPEIFTALEGYDNFSCTYTESAFENRAAAPIVRDDTVLGAVFFFKNDVENALMLEQVRLDMYSVTVAGLVLFVFVAVFFNIYLNNRFGRLLGGIAAVGRGDYDYQIEMSGNDELSGIAERFNELSRKLKRTEEVRRQFVSDASHELKTPLASIKLLSDSIEQNANVSEGDMREFVHDIGEEIQRLIRISESLLSLTRLDSVPQQEAGRCLLGACVRKCAELLRGSCEFYGVGLRLEAEGEYPVVGTEDGIFHVVFNLMENAVKYNRPGGSVWVSLHREGEQVQLVVRDDGIGIPRDELGKIFDRFYRVDKTRSRDTGGTGLGLSIVREWVGTMDGRIEVESWPGEGTAFKVYLPAWKE